MSIFVLENKVNYFSSLFCSWMLIMIKLGKK